MVPAETRREIMDKSDRLKPQHYALSSQLDRTVRLPLPRTGHGMLVEEAKILGFEGPATIADSAERHGLVSYVVSGNVVIEVTIKDRPGSHVFVMDVLGRGDCFCLPPTPSNGAYCVRAIPWPRANGDSHALVAFWMRETLLRTMAVLSPAAHLAAVEGTWLGLSRVAEQAAAMTLLPVVDRLRIRLDDLARRFGVRSGPDTLIDLLLPDSFLARLVGSTRATMNRSVWKLHRLGEILREKRCIIVRNGPTVVSPANAKLAA
jgi:hypothetical protein